MRPARRTEGIILAALQTNLLWLSLYAICAVLPKIYAIRDELVQEQKDLAYLLYYGQEKQFYIELPENADAWETPLLLDSFVKRGETTVDSYWSKIWVQ